MAALFGGAAYLISTYYHERAHKEICRIYKLFGLIDADCKMDVNLFGGNTDVKIKRYLSVADLRSFAQAQSQVEAVGYQLIPALVIISAGVGWLIGEIIDSKANKKEVAYPVPLSFLSPQKI